MSQHSSIPHVLLYDDSEVPGSNCRVLKNSSAMVRNQELLVC